MGLFTKLFRRGEKEAVIQPEEQKKPEKPCTKAQPQAPEVNDQKPPAVKPAPPPVVPLQYEAEIPSDQGDYAKAVFLSAYAKASPIKPQGAYQGYLLYECGIRNCPAYHRALVEQGYLARSSIKDVLSAHKVEELKAALSEEGLSTTGKKATLVDRLLQNCSEDQLRSRFPEETYAISEKGQEFLDEHAAYVYLHRHKNWGISWMDFDLAKRPGFGINDTIWAIFNKRLLHTSSYGRNEYFCMFELLMGEQKYRNAIEMLLRVIYIDVSGVDGLDYLKMYQVGDFTAKEARDSFDAAVMIAPGLFYRLEKLKDYYEEAFVDRIFQWKLPLNICSKRLFLEMIHAAFDGTFDEEVYYKKLKAAYNKVIRDLPIAPIN